MWIILQKFFVVVRFDNERVHPAQAFDQHFRSAAEVSNVTEAPRSGVKGEANRIDRVMRDGESLDRDIADGKFRAGAKEAPVAMTGERAAANRFRRKRVAIDRDLEFATEHFKPADMIAMFVCKQDAIELSGSNAAERQTHDELACAQPAIDQNVAMIGRNERAISGAAAPEHGQTEHVRLVTDRIRFHKLEKRRLRHLNLPDDPSINASTRSFFAP